MQSSSSRPEIADVDLRTPTAAIGSCCRTTSGLRASWQHWRHRMPLGRVLGRLLLTPRSDAECRTVVAGHVSTNPPFSPTAGSSFVRGATESVRDSAAAAEERVRR
jgi:hypothetical protein